MSTHPQPSAKQPPPGDRSSRRHPKGKKLATEPKSAGRGTKTAVKKTTRKTTDKTTRKASSRKRPKASAKPWAVDDVGQLFKPQSESSAAAESSTLIGSKLLYELVWVKPWWLLLGFWGALLLTIPIAFNGLVSTGKAVSQPAKPATSLTPDLVVEAEAASRLGEPLSRSQPDPAATLAPDASAPMPVWPLWLMVAACAGGCFVMTRQGIAPPRSRSADSPARRRAAHRRRPSRKQALPAHSKTLTRGKSLASGDEPVAPAQVMTVWPDGSIQRHSAPRSAPSAASRMAAKPTAKPVDVVPQQRSHPLDWREGSLAHQRDLRSRRSLNSWL